VVSKVRAQRIADRIREELSDILVREIQDPRIAGVYVTDVKVDRELEYASIFVSAVEGSERAHEILEGLVHAQGYLRSELARRIELRSFPRLRFNWDPTYEKAERLEQLFASIRDESQEETDTQQDEQEDQDELDQEQED
jgi:ribosome-binding factor A